MISTVKIANVKRATYTYDFMGRLTDYKEFATDGTTVKYERKSTYNNKSELTQDIITEVRTDGTWVSTTGYIYTDASGVYKGGVVVSQTTYTTKNGTSQPTSSLANTFYWWSGAVTNVATYTPDTSHPATTQTSTYTYDTLGNLASVAIVDGRPRTVSFVNTLDGKVLQRDEADNNNNTGDPRELHYYFNGIGVGDVSNNGTSDVDYAASIAEHLVIPGSGPFRDGSSSSTSYADFDQSYDPINGLNYQSTATRYTVQAGDTLESIAYALWGDASYWYLIADANGLTGSETLVAGQDLIIPDKIHNVHNNSDTYRVYDPNEAMGNTSPTAPKKPKHHGSGCGIIGQIIMVIVAVIVTIYLPPVGLAMDALIMAGAMAATDIAIQGVALATGMQSKFNWGEVAGAAIGGAVSGGLGASGVFSGISEALGGGVVGDFVQGAVTAAAGNVLTQGIDMAVGLQNKFDWAGVAASAIGGGVASAVSGQLPGAGHFVSDGGATPHISYVPADGLNTAISGMAGAIANAGARSLINGSDFGDNLMQALPSVIGNTVGGALASKIASWGDQSGGAEPSGGSDDQTQEYNYSDGTTIDYTPSNSEPVPLADAAVPYDAFANYFASLMPQNNMQLIMPTLPDMSAYAGVDTSNVIVPTPRPEMTSQIETVIVSAANAGTSIEPVNVTGSIYEQRITKFAQDLRTKARAGKITDLEAMARVVDKLASYGLSNDDFVNLLGKVLAGVTTGNLQNPNNPLVRLGQTGFASGYQEPQFGDANDQVRHFIAWLVAGYTAEPYGSLGTSAAEFVNLRREIFTSSPTGTWADLWLGNAGITIGEQLRGGQVSQVKLGSVIRRDIGAH